MPRKLVVENHPQKATIIKSLIAGESPYKIAKRLNPKVSVNCIYSFRKRRLDPALALTANVSKNKLLPDGLPANNGNVTRGKQTLVDGILETAESDEVQAYVREVGRFDHLIDAGLEQTFTRDENGELVSQDPKSLAMLHKQHLQRVGLQAKILGIGHINGAPATQNTNSITVFMPGHSEPADGAGELETIEAEVVDVTGKD